MPSIDSLQPPLRFSLIIAAACQRRQPLFRHFSIFVAAY